MPKTDVAHIKPINGLLVEEMGDDLWVIDLFSSNQYAPSRLANLQHTAGVDGVLFNPPTSWKQAERYVKQHGQQWDGTTRWWSMMKDMAASIIRPGGKAICIGWDSNGLGKSRGFTLERMLVVAHGGHWHDTLICVERKVVSESQYELTVLTTPYHHHYLNVWVPDDADLMPWVEAWLKTTTFAGSRIVSINRV
jgi:hypothetical protein